MGGVFQPRTVHITGADSVVAGIVVGGGVGQAGGEDEAGAGEEVMRLAQGAHESDVVGMAGGRGGQREGEVMAAAGLAEDVDGAAEDEAVVRRVIADAGAGVAEVAVAGAGALGATAGTVTMAVGAAFEQGAVGGGLHAAVAREDAAVDALIDRTEQDLVPEVGGGRGRVVIEMGAQKAGQAGELALIGRYLVAALGLLDAAVPAVRPQTLWLPTSSPNTRDGRLQSQHVAVCLRRISGGPRCG